MELTEFKSYFTDIFQKNCLEQYINDEIIEKFHRLTRMMLETNQVMNITAITTVERIIPLHYADCVKVAEYIPRGATVADIGCGGGFPMLPLAIVRPDLRMVGIDSTDKKIRYVQNVAKEIGLAVTAISGRAENLAKTEPYRDAFDVTVSRAVARLSILDELCMPFTKPGGCFIAMKGAAGQVEVEEARDGIKKLAGSIECVNLYSIQTADQSESRVIVKIRKEGYTPKEYPRGFGQIKKKPL